MKITVSNETCLKVIQEQRSRLLKLQATAQKTLDTHLADTSRSCAEYVCQAEMGLHQVINLYGIKIRFLLAEDYRLRQKRWPWSRISYKLWLRYVGDTQLEAVSILARPPHPPQGMMGLLTTTTPVEGIN